MNDGKVKTVEEKALELPGQIRALPEIADQSTLDRANKALSYIREIKKEINSTFDPIIGKAHETHKEAIAQKKKHIEPVELAERTVKASIGAYVEAQLEIKREAEEKARLEAERLRQEAEEKAAKAAELENEGSGEAEAVFSESLEAHAKAAELLGVPKPAVPVMSGGASVRKTWDYEILNASVIPREFLIPDEKLIGRTVKAMQDKTNIPGVRVFSRTIVFGGR